MKKKQYPAKQKLWWATHKKPCIDCGALIALRSTRCKHCNVLWEWETGRKHKSQFPQGNMSGSWKGGRVKSASGYIMIYKPEHHRADKHKYVMEHIIIWETAHGKPLPRGWIIHHLNGIKADNRPKNL